MRIKFNIDNYEEVYDKLVNVLSFEQDIFLTDDVIEIEENDFDTIKEVFVDLQIVDFFII